MGCHPFHSRNHIFHDCSVHQPDYMTIVIYYNSGYTLRLLNIAMENEPFIDDVPIKSDDFPWLC